MHLHSSVSDKILFPAFLPALPFTLLAGFTSFNLSQPHPHPQGLRTHCFLF